VKEEQPRYIKKEDFFIESCNNNDALSTDFPSTSTLILTTLNVLYDQPIAEQP
jgi:hypothetical protein